MKNHLTILAICTVIGAPLLAQGRVENSRPTDLIAADLNIEEATFITCFKGVSPDPNHAPNGAQQRANKAILLPCLQAANADITNDILDSVMDRYRPEGPMRH